MAALVGCGKPFPYVGVWRGYREIGGAPGADPDILRQIGKVEVSINGADRFAMSVAGLPVEGPVSYDGGKAVLTPQLILKRPIEQQPEELRKAIPTAKLAPNKDGTVTFEAPGQAPLVLERIATTPYNRP